MSEYQEKHHHHGDKTENSHNKRESHGNQQEHADSDYYSNYGSDYGERARRILEQSSRRSSAFEPIELSHHMANLSMNGPEEEINKSNDMFELCNTNRFQRRRHSMFEDANNPRLSRAKPVIHNIKQLHLDDIVLAYEKKHAQEEATKQSTHVHYDKDNEAEKFSKTNWNDNCIPRDNHEDRHGKTESKHKTTSDCFIDRPIKLHYHGNHFSTHTHGLSFTSRRHGDDIFDRKLHGKLAHSNMDRYEKRRSSDVGIVHRSPSDHEVHRVHKSRTNGYKSELTSPELEKLRAIHGRETRTKESERQAIARIITEECRKRHDTDHEPDRHSHGYRCHSGYNLSHDSDADLPVPGERRHTLASTTGKEIQRRRRHTNKGNKVHTASANENMRRNEADDTDFGTDSGYSNHGDRKHVSHDDVTSAQSRSNHDFVLAPHQSDRRHSWATIPNQRH
ncbi:hypothetical protein ACF0H5_000373 [Mactra antiquata]